MVTLRLRFPPRLAILTRFDSIKSRRGRALCSGNKIIGCSIFMDFITKNSEETQQLARQLAKQLIKMPHGGALVLALEGDLGAGKTTFIQGLGRALGIKEKILSPTFVIMKHFNISAGGHFDNFYHLDCYRIEGADDLEVLNFKEIISEQKNLVVIEWAERIKKALPPDTVWLEFKHKGNDLRGIKMI